MRANLLKSGTIYAVANIMAAGAPFLLLPILTRALTPAQYGQVVSFYLLVAVCMSLAGLSLHAAVGVRWLDPAKGDPRSYTASAVAIVFASTGIAALLSAVIAPRFDIGLPPAICALAAITAGATALQGMRFAVWQSREQALPAAVLQVCSALLNIALSLAAVLWLQWGGLGRIGGAAAAGVIVAITSVVLLWTSGVATRPSMADSRALLRFGIPLMPHALAGALLTSADRFAVSAQMGAESLGVYGAASQLGLVINVLADAVTKAYTPAMYRLLGRDTLRSRLRVVALAYLSVPAWFLVALGLWALMWAVGGVLLGQRYLAALDLTIWFLLGGALTGVYLQIAGLFFFTGRTEWISVATLSASVLAIVMAPVAVARFGLLGAAATYLTAQVALVAVAWLLSMRIRPMPWSRPVLALRVLARYRELA